MYLCLSERRAPCGCAGPDSRGCREGRGAREHHAAAQAAQVWAAGAPPPPPRGSRAWPGAVSARPPPGAPVLLGRPLLWSPGSAHALFLCPHVMLGGFLAAWRAGKGEQGDPREDLVPGTAGGADRSGILTGLRSRTWFLFFQRQGLRSWTRDWGPWARGCLCRNRLRSACAPL